MISKDKRNYILRPLDAGDLDRIYANGKHAENCIGYLRGYFDRGGKVFRHTWFNKHDDLHSPDFASAFDDYINHLRKSGILGSYDELTSFCVRYPETAGDFLSGPNYCFVTKAEGYVFCLRCILNRGDYNVYCFCYPSGEE